MNMTLNSMFGYFWILSPIILIFLIYYKKSLYKRYGLIIYILTILFSILTILLIPWLIFMFMILRGKTDSIEKKIEKKIKM